MINIKVRIKNKYFWLSIIPAVLLLVQQILGIFGIQFETDTLNAALASIIGTVFSILTILGVVNDPTTTGFADSTQALTYDIPKVSEENGDEEY